MSAISGRVGSGLRSSYAGLQVTVFGARGRMGRYVAHDLGRVGTALMLPHHGCELEMRDHKVMGDYGQIGIVPFHGRDRDSIRAAVEGSDVVVNCIGKHYQTRHAVPGVINWTFDQVNGELAGDIASVCAEAGVERLIHVGAAAADHDSDSAWARSKAKGEDAVRAAFPDATIIKPTIVSAPEDAFLTLYARMTKVLPFVPLIDFGDATYAPVNVADVAKAIVEVAMENKDYNPATGEDEFRSAGQDYELAGPSEYTQKEIVEFVFDTIKVNGQAVPVPQKLLELQAMGVGMLPNPMVNEDQVKLWALDHTIDGSLPGFEALGITPQNLEDYGKQFLLRFKPGGHFVEEAGYH
jgi:uncharacterized protein YbjT (DUF2867 family)